MYRNNLCIKIFTAAIFGGLLLIVPHKVLALTSPDIESAVNSVRAQHGLPSLSSSSALYRSSVLKAQDMCANNYWGHVSPDHSDYWFYQNSGFSLSSGEYVGENLAYAYWDTSVLINSWVNSPEHYKVMMMNWSLVGVAVLSCPGYQGVTDNHIIVAHFGRLQTVKAPVAPVTPKPIIRPAAPKPVVPAPAPVAPTPAPTPEPVVAAPVVVAATPKPVHIKTVAKVTKPKQHLATVAAISSVSLAGLVMTDMVIMFWKGRRAA